MGKRLDSRRNGAAGHDATRAEEPRRRGIFLGVTAVVILGLMTGGVSLNGKDQMPAGEPVTGSSVTPTTLPASSSAVATVSLGFNTGNKEQLAAAASLKKHGLRGTFYITSGFVGAQGYMTRDDLHRLVADGNEIGGHTVTLASLPTLPPGEAARQICNDRVNLTSWGLEVTSFAYPFGAVSDQVKDIVKNCGYNSARGEGTIRSRFSCPSCATAETKRPVDPFETRSPVEVDNRWTLSDLQNAVVKAEADQGWLQLAFHDIDDSKEQRSISPALFDAFTTWLAKRVEQGTTAVRTVHEVIGGATQPATAAPAAKPAGPGVNAIQNPSLEAAGSYGLPHCWQVGSYGQNTSELATVNPGFTGDIARRLDVSGYVSGDAKLLPTLDLGACAPTVVPGHTYSLRAWYKSTTRTQFEVYYRTKIGTWTYWTASPWFDAGSEYTQASWTTPVVPPEATAISFGLNLFSDGQLVTDDYQMFDTKGAPPIP